MPSSRPRPGHGPDTPAASAGRCRIGPGRWIRASRRVILGDVPLGAGLSSSASLQASVAWFLIQLGLVPRRPPRDFTRDVGDLHRMELAMTLQALGERVRRGRLGSARPVLQPLRPGRSRAVPRLRHAGPRPAAAGRPRAGDHRVRLEDLATAGRRDVRPAAGGVRARRGRLPRPDPPSRRVPALVDLAGAARGRLGRPRPGRPQAGPARPERERAGAPGDRSPEGGGRRRLRPPDVGLARLQPGRFREQLAGARRDDRGGRGRPRLPGRQALGRRLGRLHGQPGLGRSRRRLRRGRPDALRPRDRDHPRGPRLPRRRRRVRSRPRRPAW